MKLLDYFFFTRPVLFFPAWTFILCYKIFVDDVVTSFIWQDFSLGLKLFSFACIMGSSFILNQLADIESDRLNNKLFFLPRGLISIKEAVFLAATLFSLAFVVALKLGAYHFVLITLFFLITGVAYNFKPFQWKNQAILGAFANLAMGVLAILYGANSYDQIGLGILTELALIGFVLFVLTTLPDKDGDLKTDKITFGNRFNEATLLKGLIVLLFLALFFYSTLYATIFLALLSVTIILRLRNFISIELVIKLNLFAQALFVSYFYLDYAIAMLVIFLFGRWYYKRRFAVEYPNFK